MGNIMGNKGYINVAMQGAAPTAGNAIRCIDNWTMDFTEDVIETTSFGTATCVMFKSFEGGLKGATGSAAGGFDGEDTALSTFMSIMVMSVVSSVNMALYLNNQHWFSVTCVVSGFNVNDTIADKVAFGFAFTVSGDPIYV